MDMAPLGIPVNSSILGLCWSPTGSTWFWFWRSFVCCRTEQTCLSRRGMVVLWGVKRDCEVLRPLIRGMHARGFYPQLLRASLRYINFLAVFLVWVWGWVRSRRTKTVFETIWLRLFLISTHAPTPRPGHMRTSTLSSLSVTWVFRWQVWIFLFSWILNLKKISLGE